MAEADCVFTLGGKLSPDLVAEIVEWADSCHMRTEWDGSALQASDFIPGQALHLFSRYESAGCEFSGLLVGAGVPFVHHWGAGDEHSAGREAHNPAWEKPAREFGADNAGTAQFSAKEIREAMTAGTLDDLLEAGLWEPPFLEIEGER